MKYAVSICACAALLAIGGLAWRVAILVNHVDDLALSVPQGIQAMEGQISGEGSQIRLDALQRIDHVLLDLDKVITTLDKTEVQLEAVVGTADGAVDGIHADVSTTLKAIPESLQGIRADVQAVTTPLASTITDLDSAVKDMDTESVKAMRDARLTLAQTGRAAGEIQRAMPMLLDGVDKVVANSDRATAASANAAEQTSAVMKNFAIATKPLPLPARIFLQVAPPLAGFAAGMASTYSVLH